MVLKLSQADIHKAAERIYDQGQTLRSVASSFGVTHSALRFRLRDAGFPPVQVHHVYKVHPSIIERTMDVPVPALARWLRVTERVVISARLAYARLGHMYPHEG